MEKWAVEMRNITMAFGDNIANNDLDFILKEGTIHGLLGENGAGKTTLMNVLYGLYQPQSGEVYIHGKREMINSPVKAISLGIGMVHQHFMLARPLSVVENIMIGRKSRRGFLLDTKETAEEIRELAEKYKMDLDPFAKIWQLSVGEQQRVEILTALYLGAKILIMDEPTAVLTPQEVDVLFETLRQMKADGKSIILITHKLEEILSIVDEVTVLRDGERVGSCAVDLSTRKEDLSKMMVGRNVLFNFDKNDCEPGEMRVRVENIFARNSKGLPALSNFSLEIRCGEILGLAGVDGNGQKELCEIMTGLSFADSGTYTLDHQDYFNKSPAFYIANKVAHIPEDRQNTGLALDWSIKKNLVLKNYFREQYCKYKILNKQAIETCYCQAKEDYQIKAGSGEESAGKLSGGNQQKVILARELSESPSLLIANQPTRGLDVGASEYVRQQLLNARNEGTSVLLISADLEEIMQLSDRIAVIYNGQNMGVLPKGTPDHKIGRLMLGERIEAKDA